MPPVLLSEGSVYCKYVQYDLKRDVSRLQAMRGGYLPDRGMLRIWDIRYCMRSLQYVPCWKVRESVLLFSLRHCVL
jgi:hypothetical protein